MRQAQGKLDQADPLLLEFADSGRRLLLPDHRYQYLATGWLGELRLAQERFAEAEPLLRESLAGRQKVQPGHWETFRCKSLLGSALTGLAQAKKPTDAAAAERKLNEAEPLLLAAYEGLKVPPDQSMRPQRRERVMEALRRLVHLYTVWEKPDDVSKWRAALNAKADMQTDPR